MMKLEYGRGGSMIGTSCVAIVLLGLASAPQAATQDHYVATTKSAVADDETPVQAGTLTWICEGNQCRISGPWPTPGVGACKELAQKVGVIASYGYKGSWLTPQQLAICNKGIQEPSASPDSKPEAHEPIKEGIPVGPNTDVSRVQKPAPTGNMSTSEARATLRERRSEALRDRLPDSTYQASAETDLGDVQNPAINSKLREARKAQANEDLRFLQARDRLREGNVVIDGGSIFVYIR